MSAPPVSELRTRVINPALEDPGLRLDAAAAEALATGCAEDPFALLGPHADAQGVVVRAFLPSAEAVELIGADGDVIAPLQPLQLPGLYAGRMNQASAYRLRIHWPGGVVQVTEDPYSFGLLLGELDVYLLSEGNHLELGRCLGAQVMSIDNIAGVRFAVWAPNARRVSVVGDFNSWDGRRHPMRLRHEAGVWEIFVPRLAPGALYKYELLGPDGTALPLKADPVAWQVEPPPATASVVTDPAPFRWSDSAWCVERPKRQAPDTPLAIYEVHAGSWFRHPDRRPLNWSELAEKLVDYVSRMGFTHVEFMPVMSHPFGGSWGYQPLGQFAPNAQQRTREEFALLIDGCYN